MKKRMIIGSLVLFLYSCGINNIEKNNDIVKTNTGIIKKKLIENKELNKQKNKISEIEKNNLDKNKKLEKFLENKKNNFAKLDYKSDSSITKYTDNKISYNKIDYIPENLVDLKGEFLIDAKGNQKIRKITLENLEKLSSDFYHTFNKKLKIVSAYRSYAYQKGIKDRGCPDTFCAKAGYSEHQSGLAVDLWEASEKERFEKNKELKSYFEWMKDNGYKYGFENSYQKGVEIDGYAIEPWHWRYVGVELATKLKKEKITFAEFYYKNNPPLTPPLSRRGE